MKRYKLLLHASLVLGLGALGLLTARPAQAAVSSSNCAFCATWCPDFSTQMASCMSFCGFPFGSGCYFMGGMTCYPGIPWEIRCGW